MGDYGFYIWAAYGVAGISILALILAGLRDYRVQQRALARLEGGHGGGHD